MDSVLTLLEEAVILAVEVLGKLAVGEYPAEDACLKDLEPYHLVLNGDYPNFHDHANDSYVADVKDDPASLGDILAFFSRLYLKISTHEDYLD